MTNDEGLKPEGAPERSPKAGVGAPSGVDENGPKRFSVQRKMAIVARLLRGEPLELVARETNVSIARLTEWRERALAGSFALLRATARGQRRRRALHPNLEREPAVGEDLRHHRRAASRTRRVRHSLQRHLARRSARLSYPSPGASRSMQA